MKNIWKILAAMMIVALPFAVASCGGDDEEEIPTLTYVWELKNVSIDKVSEDQQATVINARNQINKMIAAAYRSATVETPESKNAHFTVKEDEKQFSIQTEKRAEDIDDEVYSIFLDLKKNEAFRVQTSILNDNKIEAKLVINRGKTMVVDNKAIY
jgi:hypothetical protein